MSSNSGFLRGNTLDSLLFDLDSLKQHETLSDTVTTYIEGNYKATLENATSQTLSKILANTVSSAHGQLDAALQDSGLDGEVNAVLVLITGLAAFDAFLQANVTGPPQDLRDIFKVIETTSFREQCLKSLEVDGVSVYQHIPHVELFCLSRLIFTTYFPRLISGNFVDSKWMRVRINAYHQRLLSGLSCGRISDSTALQDAIEKDLMELETEILESESKFSTEAKVQFLLEKAQIYIMQGLDFKAKENVQMAKTVSGFSYALSGALGKRTKFQQNDISQLVVFARSKDSEDAQNVTPRVFVNSRG